MASFRVKVLVIYIRFSSNRFSELRATLYLSQVHTRGNSLLNLKASAIIRQPCGLFPQLFPITLCAVQFGENFALIAESQD